MARAARNTRAVSIQGSCVDGIIIPGYQGTVFVPYVPPDGGTIPYFPGRGWGGMSTLPHRAVHTGLDGAASTAWYMYSTEVQYVHTYTTPYNEAFDLACWVH